jgi:hypothetical protein
MTFGYFISLMDLTGTTNNRVWKQVVKEGSALFLGADGHYRPGDGWNVGYYFGYAPEEQNIAVAAGLVVPLKLGWEYLDVRYREVKDAAANITKLEPFEAHVHSVYRTSNFDDLNL